MLRMQFYELPDCIKMQLEGRFVREFAEHARTVIGRSVVPSNLVVDLSEVSFVDAVGEEVLLWFKGIGVKFAAESAYARHVCECLQLPIYSDRSAGSQHVRHRTRRRAPGCEPSKEQVHVPLQRRNAVMKPLHPNPTERCQISTIDVALQSEMPTLTEMEELYWFAMALTGDPEFAAKLVVDTKKLPSTGRGVFRN